MIAPCLVPTASTVVSERAASVPIARPRAGGSGEWTQETRIMPPLSETIIERLAELWCEALLANLRRHPIPALQRVS